MDRQVVEISSLSLSFCLFLWLSTYLPTYLSMYPYLSLSLCLCVYLSIDRSIYLSVHLPIYLSTYLPIYLSIYLSVYLSISLSLYRSIDRSIYLSIYLSICLSVYLSIYLSVYLSIYLSNYRSIYLSVYLSICLSVCLSICKRENEDILGDFLSFWTWQHQKRSNSARRPQFLNLITSKTKQFCETSSFFEIDNIKNETILRDFLQKWKVECRADGLVPMRFAIFPVHLSKVPRLPRQSMKKWCQVIRSAAPVTQNHLSKPEDLMLQNATPLKKSAPWPLNISDEHVSCTGPATENASLQILFKRPTPAIVFGNATKPSPFAHFWQGAQSLAPARRNDIWTSKSGPSMVFLTFWLRNVLPATTACTFSTSQLPKVVRSWCALYILTSKWASRHNGVHFFDISISKSGPSMVCFVHFDFEMCFVPQRRALFRQLNFRTWSEHGVFCTFWLRNVLRATTACTFSTCQLPKVVRSCGVLYILTWKCASRHNGVQFLISHLASWLRTRRFSEPTFRPSGATNYWKNTASRDFPTFWRTWIFFLLLFSSLTLPISACRKIDF